MIRETPGAKGPGGTKGLEAQGDGGHQVLEDERYLSGGEALDHDPKPDPALLEALGQLLSLELEGGRGGAVEGGPSDGAVFWPRRASLGVGSCEIPQGYAVSIVLWVGGPGVEVKGED
jgi:hypothetical protein